MLRKYTRTDTDDEIRLLFEGQSWDWLTNSLRAVMRAYEEIWLRDHWKAERDAFLQALDGLNPVRDRRNFVIHSVMYPVCPWKSDKIGCIAVDEGDPADGYHFERSRTRRVFSTTRHLSLDDLEGIASDMSAARQGLKKLWRAAYRARHPHLASPEFPVRVERRGEPPSE